MATRGHAAVRPRATRRRGSRAQARAARRTIVTRRRAPPGSGASVRRLRARPRGRAAETRMRRPLPIPARPSGWEGRGHYWGPRTASGWASMPGSREERVARRGARVELKPYYRRRVKMGAPGWWVRNRIPQSPKLLAAKVVERDRQLRCGQFEVCASQDGHELVRLGHKISPAFMISQKDKDRLICDDGTTRSSSQAS